MEMVPYLRVMSKRPSLFQKQKPSDRPAIVAYKQLETIIKIHPDQTSRYIAYLGSVIYLKTLAYGHRCFIYVTCNLTEK